MFERVESICLLVRSEEGTDEVVDDEEEDQEDEDDLISFPRHQRGERTHLEVSDRENYRR